MTQNQNETDLDIAADTFVEPSKLELLKRKAKTLGITFRENISEAKLESKIEDYYAALEKGEDEADEEDGENKPSKEAPKLTSKEQKALEVFENRKRSQLLHRVILNPIDPRRTQLPGEFVTVGNSQLGFTGKFLPFNREVGYHIPQILLDDLKARTFTEFYTIKDRDGNDHTKSRQRKAFLIEILESITQEEFDAIRSRQQGQSE